jgi:hypothetical protein
MISDESLEWVPSKLLPARIAGMQHSNRVARRAETPKHLVARDRRVFARWVWDGPMQARGFAQKHRTDFFCEQRALTHRICDQAKPVAPVIHRRLR